jgi:hypothetical protein
MARRGNTLRVPKRSWQALSACFQRYQLGLQRKAEPQERLQSRYQEFQRRMCKRAARKGEAAEIVGELGSKLGDARTHKIFTFHVVPTHCLRTPFDDFRSSWK